MTLDEIITAAVAEAAAILSRDADERLERLVRLQTTALARRFDLADAGDAAAEALTLAAARLSAASILAAEPESIARLSVGDLTIEGRGASEAALALERSAAEALRLAFGSAPARLIAVRGGKR